MAMQIQPMFPEYAQGWDKDIQLSYAKLQWEKAGEFQLKHGLMY